MHMLNNKSKTCGLELDLDPSGPFDITAFPNQN